MVQLKAIYFYYRRIKSYRVSIPNGSIKREYVPGEMLAVDLFQFLMVQLKVDYRVEIKTPL